ncbi:MAG: aminodeoxychorismate synthase component I [Pseudomonadota bacterium]
MSVLSATASQRVIELPYAPDSARQFQHLSAQPWFVFLDSCVPRAPLGRFDVLAARPRATLCTRGGVTAVREGGDLQLSDADPLELLRERMGPRQPEVPDLPFCGGALGYFGYDLGRRFERLPTVAERDVDLPDMAVGVYDWAVVVDHRERRTRLVAPQARDEAWWARVHGLVTGGVSWGGSERVAAAGYQLIGECVANLTPQTYAEAFARIKGHIRAGDCYQVNFAQRFSAPVAGDAWSAYRQLREVTPAPFSSFMRLPDGAVLSSSPERFLKVRRGVVETRPIKGTRPRQLGAEADRAMAEELYRSEKDRAENVMIVDLLRNDLGKVCRPGSVRVPELWKLESFERVHHLVSTVTGELEEGADAIELLRHCFPGGSITGAPKIRAMEIIETLEPHRRSVYCGAIGYLGVDGSMDTNIAIRTMAWHGGMLHGWAGGGIVADSALDAEYQESFDKASGMLALMRREQAADLIS